MKGDATIIARLQKLLSMELSAADQYLAHAKQYEDWGLGHLHTRFMHESEEEMDHAKAIIERLHFLEGDVDTGPRMPIKIGDNVKQMMQNDLDTEYEVINELKSIIGDCEKAADYNTRKMLIKLLDDSEMDHAWWIESQIWQIEHMGLSNYIQAQRTNEAPAPGA